MGEKHKGVYTGVVGLVAEDSERGVIQNFFGEGQHASIDYLLGRALEGRRVKVTIEVLDTDPPKPRALPTKPAWEK